MKNLTTLLLLIIIFAKCYGQEKIATVTSDKSTINLIESISLKSQFLDSLFYTGRVYFKNGKSYVVQMNYSLLDNSIYFLDKNRNLLKMTGLDKINIISYSKRIFHIVNNEFFEQLYSSQNYILLLKYKTNITNKNEIKGPYGTSLESSSTESYSSMTDSQNFDFALGNYYAKNDKINVDILLNRYYFLQVNGKLNKIFKVRDLKKLFPNKKSSIITYIEDNKLELSKEQDLIKLISYCVND